MSDPNHPSQAEGEDPDRPDTGEVEAESGHPSQAEGADPSEPADGKDVSAADKVSD